MTFTFHTILKIFKIISAMYWFPEFFSFVVAGFFLFCFAQGGSAFISGVGGLWG